MLTFRELKFAGNSEECFIHSISKREGSQEVRGWTVAGVRREEAGRRHLVFTYHSGLWWSFQYQSGITSFKSHISAGEFIFQIPATRYSNEACLSLPSIRKDFLKGYDTTLHLVWLVRVWHQFPNEKSKSDCKMIPNILSFQLNKSSDHPDTKYNEKN